MTYNIKDKIIEHYDFVSPYYYSLWGEHLHHGYWKTGKETKEEAQLALTEYLANLSNIHKGSSILDVGCGFGASSIFLAQTYDAKTTGITISSVQVEMAKEAAKSAKVNSKFELMDADKLHFENKFDVIWSIESISHYKDKKNFFKNASNLLSENGTFTLIDWFKKEDLSEKEYSKYILPIEKGMLVDLHPMSDYVKFLESNGLEIVKIEDISKKTSKTWDISLSIIKNKAFWKMALKGGLEFIDFLRSFKAMKDGFGSGKFVYGLIVAKKA